MSALFGTARPVLCDPCGHGALARTGSHPVTVGVNPTLAALKQNHGYGLSHQPVASPVTLARGSRGCGGIPVFVSDLPTQLPMAPMAAKRAARKGAKKALRHDL